MHNHVCPLPTLSREFSIQGEGDGAATYSGLSCLILAKIISNILTAANSILGGQLHKRTGILTPEISML